MTTVSNWDLSQVQAMLDLAWLRRQKFQVILEAPSAFAFYSPKLRWACTANRGTGIEKRFVAHGRTPAVAIKRLRRLIEDVK